MSDKAADPKPGLSNSIRLACHYFAERQSPSIFRTGNDPLTSVEGEKGKPCVWQTMKGTGRDGSPGVTPSAPSDPIPTADPGQDGTVSIGGESLNELSAFTDTSHMRMVLHAAEMDYLNGRMQSAIDRLVWLCNLHSNLANDFGIDEAYNERRAAAHRKEIIIERCRILLRQIKLGLDYYGRCPNFAPMLKPTFFSSQLGIMINYGRIVEEGFIAFMSAEKDASKELSALKAVIKQEKKTIDLMGKANDEIISRSRELQLSIQSLYDQMRVYWVQMMEARAEFEADINQTECDFRTLITIGSAVAAVVSTGGAAVGSALAAWQAMQSNEPKDDKGNPVTGDWAKLQWYADKWVPVGKDVNALLDAYNAFGSSLKSPDSADIEPPNDSVKFLMEKKAFDSEIEKYLNLPSAQKYKSLVDTFVNVCLAKNQKILELNSLQVQYVKNQNDIRIKELDIDYTETSIANYTNPVRAEAARFLSRAQASSKARIVRLLKDANDALNFFALQTSDLQVIDYSIASLAEAASALESRFIDIKTELSQPDAKFTRKFLLSELVTEQEFNNFRSQGTILFWISPRHEHLKILFDVRTNKISVNFKGLQSGDVSSLVVRNAGYSEFRNKFGGIISFSHLPVGATILSDGAGGLDVEGVIGSSDSEFALPSISGPWNLALFKFNEELFSENLIDVELTFEGTAKRSLFE